MIFSILFPYVFIFPTVLIIYQLFQKLYSDSRYRFAIAFFLSPVLLGIIQLYLFTFFPKRPSLFYLLVFIVLTLSSLIITIYKKPVKLPQVDFKQIFHSQPVVVILSLIIFFFTIVRTCFWPITWGDQLLYLQQTYAYWQTKDASSLQQVEHIKTSNFDYQMDASIRPLMPMMYSFYYFAGSQLLYSQFYAQSIITYFFIGLILLLLFRQNHPEENINFQQNLLSIFLVLTCFDFINFTVFGFKELIIIGLTLISLDLIIKLKFTKYKIGHILYFGFLLASLAAVNYSGSVIDGILLISALVFSKGNALRKISLVVLAFILADLLSLGEPTTFLLWFLSGISWASKYATSLTRGVIANIGKSHSVVDPRIQYELSGWKIDDNLLDYYIKGKLQAFTQIQLYGMFFWFFLISIFLYAKEYFSNQSSKIYLFFTAIYIFLIFDPLNINPNVFSGILSLSPKYTILIVPILATSLSQNINKINTILRKISYKTVLFLLFMAFITSAIVYLFLYQNVTHIFLTVMQVFRNADYYTAVIKNISLACMLFSVLCIILIIISQKNYKIFLNYWKQYNLSFTFIAIIPIFSIFAVPFQTNFGLINTIIYTPASIETKLSNINGDENFFRSIFSTKYLIESKVDKNNRILFFNIDAEFPSFYTEFKPADVLTLSNSGGVAPTIANPDLRYILTTESTYTTNRGLFDYFQIIYQNPDYVLLEKE